MAIVTFSQIDCHSAALLKEMAVQIGIWSFIADLNWIECAVTLGGQSIPALLF
jgi:hypothetical protein